MSIFAATTLAAAPLVHSALAPSSIIHTAKDVWLDNPAIRNAFWPSVVETLAMTGWSTLVTVLIGTPLGLLLVATSRGGLLPNRLANQILGLTVNVGRSIPFIILLIAVLPFTRWMVGTTLGWKAAVVPLSIGAIPFFARLVETNVRSVHAGKIEAAHMMGASRWEIMMGVQVREALPALIDSITVLAVTLISYSAIAGALGGGGLGQLAMNYGYHRFQADTMLVSVVGIIVLVQIIQVIGDMLSRLVDHR